MKKKFRDNGLGPNGTFTRTFGPEDARQLCKAAAALLREPNNPAAQQALKTALNCAGVKAQLPQPLTPQEQAEHEARVFAERGKIYGEATFAHGNLGLYFTALIQQHYDLTLPHPIPSDLAMMMIAANKLNRMARPNAYHEDNFVDLRVYTGMAERAQRARLSKEVDRAD